MKDLIRKILIEETQKNEVFIDENVKNFLFSYWEKNGTELTPYRYLGLDTRNPEVDKTVDKLKIEFYGGYNNALELAKKELGMNEKIHISDGGYEFDFTTLAVGFLERKEDDFVSVGFQVRITDGSVQFLDGDDDYRWDLDELFHGDNNVDEDTLFQVSIEISGSIKEYLHEIFEKYGLFVKILHHNYRDAWQK